MPTTSTTLEGPAGAAAPVRLEAGVRYVADLGDVSYGRIPREALIATLASGRLASILIEQDIAARFGIDAGGQGAGPDLICPTLGTMQLKTFRSDGDAVYRSGANAGLRKAAAPRIWTTKSGFFDRRSRLTPEQVAQAREYLSGYDYFVYVDISALLELRYEFVVVPATQVCAASTDGFYISEDAINAGVTRTVVLT